MGRRVIPDGGLVAAARVTPWTVVTEDESRRIADRQILQRWTALDGSPGGSNISGASGLIMIGDNFYREYTNGAIYYSTHSPESPLYLYGDIGGKYAQLGGPNSWLGWPTSDEQLFAEDGRVVTFEHGAIYWWPDTGAIELGNIAVRYRGLHCFGETDEPSAHDEPYAIFGVVPSPPGHGVVQTQIYRGVDGGNSRADNVELYSGPPNGLALGVTFLEHDHGDPNKFKEQVNAGVVAASSAVVAAGTAVGGPLVGGGLAVILEEVGPFIVDGVNGILGTDDDIIDKKTWNITAKQMVTLPRGARQDFYGIDAQLASELLSDGEASYAVYLDIVTA